MDFANTLAAGGGGSGVDTLPLFLLFLFYLGLRLFWDGNSYFHVAKIYTTFLKKEIYGFTLEVQYRFCTKTSMQIVS
jgi:hypothetical protein